MKRVSTIALGLVLFTHQMMSFQMAQAAQLSLGSHSDTATEVFAPEAEIETAQLKPNPEECESKPTKSKSPELEGKVSAPGSQGSALSYQATEPSPQNGQLVAQQPGVEPADDCCEVSGNSLCEVAGLPPVGGGALLASPLLALAGLPLAAIPFLDGGGDGRSSPPEVPEPSTTAGLVAGVGAIGVFLSRRRNKRKD
jgi:hypothetical protein